MQGNNIPFGTKYMIKKFVVRLSTLSCCQSVAAMDFREHSSRVHPIHCLRKNTFVRASHQKKKSPHGEEKGLRQSKKKDLSLIQARHERLSKNLRRIIFARFKP